MIRLIIDYDLSPVQLFVLLLNYDICFLTYLSERSKKEYLESDLNILNCNINDMYINNLKKLVPCNFDEYLNIGSIEYLKNSFIFTINTENIVKNYNINYTDITKLIISKRIKTLDELTKYIELIKDMDEETKESFYKSTTGIFASTYIFPSLQNDPYFDKNKGKYVRELIINENPEFFKGYTWFFQK